MAKPLIIVTGSNGQLGTELAILSPAYDQFEFVFFKREALDITSEVQLKQVFATYRPAYFVNCAAYTAVDKAESDHETAMRINAAAVGIIAACCHTYGTKLIHISTDYVFNGKASQPYPEDAPVNPVNYYGLSKLKGEEQAIDHNPGTIILRTSWVYNRTGKNFVTTMLRLMQERTDISVVNDQTGTPTYAVDLAEAIMLIITGGDAGWHPGIYHYSNGGIITWYEFALAIKEIRDFSCTVHPIATEQYPTPAKRPVYAVMSKEKITTTFNLQVRDWRNSLEECLKAL